MDLKKTLSLVFIVSLFSAILFSPSGRPSYAQSDPVPRFEDAACPFILPEGQVEGETVNCGYLIVPENRSDPASPTIKLAVAIFKSTSDTPQAPMIRLDGGPGGHSVATIGEQLYLLSSSEHLLARGDLILIDQRGVGLSEPSLACTEINELSVSLFDVELSFADEAVEYNNALTACRERLVSEGVNLNAYTSAENAADIHDLWTTLGLESVNIYGVSYGTRLALTIMRDFPDGIRSVILDSSFPLQANLYVDIDHSAQRAMSLLFDECAASAECSANFPNLEKLFFDTIEQLNAQPAELTLTSWYTGESYNWIFTGNDLYDLTFQMLYVSQIIGYLPAIIEQTAQGQYMLAELLASAFLLDFSVDYGMYYSVQCAEEVPFQSLEDLTAALTELEPNYRYFGELSAEYFSVFSTCELWNVAASDEIEQTPVTSDIPTLVVAGQYDPITPPHYGRATAETLSNSFFFEYPGLGHGVFDEGDCPLNITLAFLDDPTTEPPSSCIAEMRLEYLIP